MSEAPVSAALDRTERTGSPGLVLLLAVVLVGAAASFSFLPQEQAGRLTIGLLAVLAIAGVTGLFAFAVGFLQFSGQAARNDITKLVADSGIPVIVPDRGGAADHARGGAGITYHAGSALSAAHATLRLLHNPPRGPFGDTVTTNGHFEALFADYASVKRGERQVA